MGNVYLWKIVIDSNDHNFLPRLIHICSSISNSLRPCLSREHRLSFTFILSFTPFYFVVLTFHSRFKFHLITSFAKRSSGFPLQTCCIYTFILVGYLQPVHLGDITPSSKNYQQRQLTLMSPEFEPKSCTWTRCKDCGQRPAGTRCTSALQGNCKS